MNFPVEALWEEEMIRSGSHERRKKIGPGGSGSGDLDSVADVVLSFSTVLYPVSTTTTTLGATTAGTHCPKPEMFLDLEHCWKV